jgi:hypothetical protein
MSALKVEGTEVSTTLCENKETFKKEKTKVLFLMKIGKKDACLPLAR